MIIQDALIRRIEVYVESLRRQAKNEHLMFKVSTSNTTNSIYVKVLTFLDDGEKIQASYRISDHLNSKVNTKLVAKHTKFTTIERNIDKLIDKVNKLRTKKVLEKVSKGDK